jgi:radical SAM superfamily enzyme YgiQ (UPF0313 family)
MNKIRKILLINSAIQGLGDKYVKTVNYSCYPPLGILTIATRLRQSFPQIEVRIIDAEITALEQIKEFITKEQPDIIGFSVLTPTYETALALASFAKKTGVKHIVFGNDHASFFPELILKKRHFIDFVIQGDNGDIDFCNLVDALLTEKNPFQHINNLYGRINGKIIKSKTENVPIDKKFLSVRDFPDFSLLEEGQRNIYIDYYNKDFGVFHNKRIVPVTINNASGCSNYSTHCLYCGIYNLKPQWGKSELFWEAAYKYHEQYKINLLFEVCDNFGGMRKYRKNLIESMPEWFKHSDIEFLIYSRANDIFRDSTIIEDFKKLHVKRVIVGLEAGNDFSIKSLRKGHPEGKETYINKYAVEKLAEAGLQLHSSFILGCLGENRESIAETRNFLTWLSGFNNIVSIEVSPLYPIPLSPSWDLLLGITPSKFYGNDIESPLKEMKLTNYKKGWEIAKDEFADNDIIDNKLACEIWCNYFTHVPYNELVRIIDDFNEIIKHHTSINIGAFL